MPAEPLRTPYRIVTPSVVVRCWEPADAPALHALVADNMDHLGPWVPWIREEPRTLSQHVQEVRHWRASFDVDQDWYWAVLGDDGELAGAVLLNRIYNPETVDIGGWTSLARARRGYQTDAMAAVARAAFEVLGMTRVQALSVPANERSAGLLSKLGFTHEGTTRHMVEGQQSHEWVWSIMADEWPSTYAAQIASEALGFDALGNRVF